MNVHTHIYNMLMCVCEIDSARNTKVRVPQKGEETIY